MIHTVDIYESDDYISDYLLRRNWWRKKKVRGFLRKQRAEAKIRASRGVTLKKIEFYKFTLGER